MTLALQLPKVDCLPNTRRPLPISLLRAREAVMAKFRPMLARHDVTEQQWRVVRALSEASPLDASELARRAALLPPSLSRIVRAMEERRLIKRGKPEGDARRVLFSITPAGQALIKAVSPEREEIYRSIEQHFGPAELQRLLDMLDRLIERMEEA
jgi:homoprotocatechuate degradation regulator HpaR